MDRHLSSAMFISEIPVRCMHNGEKCIKWIDNLNRHTTARDIITSLLPACDSTNYSLYIHIDRKKQILNDSARIYKVVARINQEKTSGKLLFEIVSKKRVRFADEIIIQTIHQGQAIALEKRLQILKENFQKHIIRQENISKKLSLNIKRSSLKVISSNLPHSSSESGISSISSTEDLKTSTKAILETLV
ncbi:hypothetical protein I4U23_007784 [Adineta vaga]|nr:hypothetical protein I4U23_007784 [Adineta vaga]